MIRLPVAPDPDALPMHHNCARCPAMCCNYISTEIDEPTSKRDIDIIRWYLMHSGVRVYCEDRTGSWFVQFMARCRFLQDDHRCGIYEIRPQICRDLQATECEFALGPGDRYLFTNLEEFDRWLRERERRLRVRRERRASGRPAKGATRRRRNGAGSALVLGTAGRGGVPGVRPGVGTLSLIPRQPEAIRTRRA